MKNKIYIIFTALLLYCWTTDVTAECNGGTNLCQQSYSNITQLITHDSYALAPSMAATQDFSIVDQLNDGVRGIKLSAVPSLDDPEAIHLCHTVCAVLDAGLVSDTLRTISTWLEENPKEVVTIMWNNLYDLDAVQIARAYEASTIMPFVYTHNQSSWPTLQEMIDSGKRLVNFIDAKADPVQVPWLMDQFSNVFETPYDNTDMDSFNCNVDRIAPDYNPNDLMYVVNHFIYGVIHIGKAKIEIPLRDKAQVTNAKTLLNQHVQNCTTVFQKRPNFIEVDFYSVGDALEIVANLNDIPSLATNKASSLTVQDNTSTTQSFEQTKEELVSIVAEHVVIDNVSSSTNSVHNYYFSIVMLAILFNHYI